MKNVLMLIAVIFLAATTGMADEAKTAVPANMAKAAMPVPPAPAAEKTAVGKVKSVSMADAAKGTKSEIVLTTDAGAAVNFLVTATTTLYDADAKALTLDKIAVDSKVDVVYGVTAEGVNEAKSVKIVK